MEQNKNSERSSHAEIAALLDFTPIAVRYRRDGWTPERQRLYVAALAGTGHAGKAARAVGMTEQSAARLRRRPDAASFDRACQVGYSSARRRWAMTRLAAARRRPSEGSNFLCSMEAEL
jgi:hypothetical protein